MPDARGSSPERPDRTAELVAAAVAGALEPAEAEEYAALVAADPAVAAETAALRAVLDRLDGGPATWDEPEPSPGLRARVLAVGHATRPVRQQRRRLPLAAAAAVALLVVGVGLGVAGSRLGDDTDPSADPSASPSASASASPSPQGPPGTLGALEQIDFRGAPRSVDVDGALVAHTWGTETMLRVDGLTPGDRFEVVLLGADGEVEDSGTFLGSKVAISCRLNAALLRQDVSAVEVLDASGAVVARSDVPRVSPG